MTSVSPWQQVFVLIHSIREPKRRDKKKTKNNDFWSIVFLECIVRPLPRQRGRLGYLSARVVELCDVFALFTAAVAERVEG